MPCLSPEQVNESFIANAPLISSTIKNMTLQAPNWFRDLYTATPWPEGEGNLMQQLTFRGELPAVEEGFDSWSLISDPSGCDPGCTPNCSYNMSVLGGHAMESKIVRLMTKDFRTPDYCVKSISSTRQYKEMFAAIISNLYNQINFQKEVNVGQNFLTGIAKKYIIDSGGFKPNSADPYMYRAKGTATLSRLTIDALEFMYEVMRRMPDAKPYSIQNGAPLYALVASPQLIARMYRDDPSLRADIRAVTGNYTQQLVERYNFTSTIRDMFFPVPYLWPRRFRWDGSQWIRVLPFVKGIPGTVGTFANINPLYEDPSYATHEEVLIHGAEPFSVYYQPTPTTIGEGTDFGPEPAGFWDVFQWVNPQTREDPARREGYFFTTATIGLSADNSESVFGILVPRAPVHTMVGFYPAAPEVPTYSAPTNVVPDITDCPNPVVLAFSAHPVTAGRYFVTFGAPIEAVADDVIQLGLTTGGYLSATVVTASSDKKVFEVTITGTDVPNLCAEVTSVYSGDTLGCAAAVRSYSVNASDNTRLDLILDRPIKAAATKVVTLFYGNGTSVSATVISTDMLTNKWVVDIGGSAFVDNVGGVKTVCVPTSTDATCGACDSAEYTATQCS